MIRTLIVSVTNQRQYMSTHALPYDYETVAVQARGGNRLCVNSADDGQFFVQSRSGTKPHFNSDLTVSTESTLLSTPSLASLPLAGHFDVFGRSTDPGDT